MSTEQAIKNAVASTEMEGFSVSEQCIDLCKRLLDEEISLEKCIELIKKNNGVVA